MKKTIKGTFFLIFAIFLFCAAAGAQDSKAPNPTKKDKCPVCGMFVYKYPDWIASVTFKDKSVFFFDGAKDMFKYLFALEKYNPGKKTENIDSIHVTEYYNMERINALDAFYVIGSDVYGPMGKELIPFLSEEDAGQFSADHGGKRILKYQEINPAIIQRLD